MSISNNKLTYRYARFYPVSCLYMTLIHNILQAPWHGMVEGPEEGLLYNGSGSTIVSSKEVSENNSLSNAAVSGLIPRSDRGLWPGGIRSSYEDEDNKRGLSTEPKGTDTAGSSTSTAST
ncbi:uncharacterized protein LOC132751643 [Ruditapes philippinarum]|uniref:uncharacterized protein LOC132751643 n=1 Tax=Ruditapes philippinarum TaxID=129788 RepID=UPI00295B9A2B|nr:uncharacterized protein LOC132751643 [Ruditapes philippinarum]